MRIPATLALALALVLPACADPSTASGDGGATIDAPTTSPAFPLTVTDDDGVEVTIESEPQRIVTFAPSATEIVFALGLGERLVGVSGPYDDFPAAAKKIDEIGGAGEFGVDPNVETVLALEPDLFLTIAGGDAWKERLRELGVPVVTIDSTDLNDVLHDIETVGRLTGATEEAAELVAEMRADIEDAEDVGAGDRVRCFFEVYYPPLLTVGPDTFIADLLDRAGCDSVSAGAKSDYPEWSVDDLVRKSPETYLVSSESGVSPDAVAERPGFDAIDAVAEGRVILIDSDLVTRAGPRVVDGLRELVEALH